MKKEIIDEHRKKYPISIDEIKFYSSFPQILGKTDNEYSNEERKERWFKNLNELNENENSDAVEYWTQPGGDGECSSCIHFTKNGGWCDLMGLPSTVNPILTFPHGIAGMACMGVGKETIEKQI